MAKRKRAKRPGALMIKSMKLAKTQVDAILARREAAKQRRANAPAARAAALGISSKQLRAMAPAVSAGLIVAEGDSWFDYPLWDVLKELEDQYGYDVDSVAHKGDAVEDMAYSGQLDDFSRHLQKHLQANQPVRVILLSGGGNDVAGDEFYMLLNHALSGLPTLSEELLSAIIDQRLKAAYTHILTVITALCEKQLGRKIPILLHAYAYPVPDGRGFLGGWFFLPGPWLKPGFDRKGYADLLENTVLMRKLIDRLYAMIYSITGTAGFEHVRVVDLRPILSDELKNEAYQQSWGNELHPTEAGFRAVAEAFVQAIERV